MELRRKKVLEIGHGPNPMCIGLDSLLRELPRNIEYHGVDNQVWESLARRYKQERGKLNRNNIYFYIMDGKKLNFESKTFDEVHLHFVAKDTAIHPSEMSDIIAEAKRVLKSDGKIITSGEGEKVLGIKGNRYWLNRALNESRFYTYTYTYTFQKELAPYPYLSRALKDTIFPPVIGAIMSHYMSEGGIFITVGLQPQRKVPVAVLEFFATPMIS